MLGPALRLGESQSSEPPKSRGERFGFVPRRGRSLSRGARWLPIDIDDRILPLDPFSSMRWLPVSTPLESCPCRSVSDLVNRRVVTGPPRRGTSKDQIEALDWPQQGCWGQRCGSESRRAASLPRAATSGSASALDEGGPSREARGGCRLISTTESCPWIHSRQSDGCPLATRSNPARVAVIQKASTAGS